MSHLEPIPEEVYDEEMRQLYLEMLAADDALFKAVDPENHGDDRVSNEPPLSLEGYEIIKPIESEKDFEVIDKSEVEKMEEPKSKKVLPGEKANGVGEVPGESTIEELDTDHGVMITIDFPKNYKK
ncbi:unnamed protein product [Caenorhabditis sp. 36 PRJEB53466]|nr:unnamed protein product [Caenorhabditis sp. 36 PRJEB53466]